MSDISKIKIGSINYDIKDASARTAVETHSHAWSEITGKPSSFPPETHSHAWSEITGKPSSFTPATHSHTWSEITGKPSSFTPASHTHSASDITSGTLAVARGGTGKSAYASTNYTSIEYRGERFASSDTTPTDNGTICWTYE